MVFSGRYILKWGVVSVGIFSTGRGSPYMGKIFQMWDMHQSTALIRNRKDEESRHVALRILFVKSIEQTCLTCIFGVKEL